MNSMKVFIVATLLVAASAIREPIQADEVACSVTCVKESEDDKIIVTHHDANINDHTVHRCYHDGANCVCFCQDPDCAEVAAAGDFGIIAAATHGETVSQNCNSDFTTDVVGSKTCTHGVFSGTNPTCTAAALPAYFQMTTSGTACSAGSVQVTDQTECHGAAKTFLISTGDVSDNVHNLATLSNTAYVPGCYEGLGINTNNQYFNDGGVNGEGNGNVHFNTNNGNGSLGYRICKAI
jgi:hypothetical protein